MRRTRGRTVDVTTLAELERRLASGVRSLSGWRVRHVDLSGSPDLLAGRYEAASDPMAHAARLSAYPGRSGDIIFITDPYWFPYRIPATHGTPYPYDQHVPMVFVGPQFTRGRYTAAASPADVAPTLGRLLGVILPAADAAAPSRTGVWAKRQPTRAQIWMISLEV